MVTEAVVSWATDLWAWFLGLFDGVQLPDFALHPPDELQTIFSYLDGFAIWIPFDSFKLFILGIIGFVLACFLVRAVRVAIGHLPFIGGNG